MKSIIIFFVVIANFVLAFAGQDTFYIPSTTIPKDTICFSYKFNPGDTLIYSASTYDSITVDYGTPLFKFRNELIRLICDSVGVNKHYYISQELIELLCNEIRGDSTIKYSESPWIGRKVWLEIDSLGKRYSFNVDDSLKAALSPGGAFQPCIINFLGETCKQINESWIAESLDDLPENGVPVPLLNHSDLFRIMVPGDTLNYKCNKLEFIRTGQGSVHLLTAKEDIKATNIVNGYGVIFLGIDSQVPVHIFTTLENKITIYTADGVKKPAWHYIFSNFTLVKISPKEPVIKKKITKQQKKKN